MAADSPFFTIQDDSCAGEEVLGASRVLRSKNIKKLMQTSADSSSSESLSGDTEAFLPHRRSPKPLKSALLSTGRVRGSALHSTVKSRSRRPTLKQASQRLWSFRPSRLTWRSWNCSRIINWSGRRCISSGCATRTTLKQGWRWKTEAQIYQHSQKISARLIPFCTISSPKTRMN